MTSVNDTAAHAALMDANYRLQRHVYDATRKYYLLGRDGLIDRLAVPQRGSVLEIGCGTGRNLALVGRCYPSARLFGLDISAAMLDTASRSLARNGLAHRTALAQADAARFDPAALFGQATFDRVFISYALSMIPPWADAIEAGVSALTRDGSLHIVDFGQQRGLPAWFRSGLRAWLARFHVTPRAGLAEAAGTVAAAHGRPLTHERLYGDYAWMLTIGAQSSDSVRASAATIG